MGKTNTELHSAVTAQLVGSLIDAGAKVPDPALVRLLVMRALAASAKA